MEIPTVDISPFREDPTSEASSAVVKEVRKAFTTYGFLQIVGHGIEPELQDAVIRGCAEFFKLPIEEKRKIDRFPPSSCGRGYEVMRTQQQQKGPGGDFKEDVLPRSSFRDPVEIYMARVNELALTMSRILAAGMPYGMHVFDEFLDGNPLALLSPKHYPPLTEYLHEEGEDPSTALACGPHTDFGSMTLLLQDMVGGLQVKHGEDAWIDMKPNRGAYVVNIGDMLHKWTKGEYKSTVHRVLSPKENVHRYSPPFFNGNLDARLIPFDQMANGTSDKVLTVKDHLLERIMATVLKEKKVQAQSVAA
ncbi:hypothetical protein NHJ13734_009356 [Beauveria thailandica]